MINHVIAGGRLTQDPIVGQTRNGVPMADLQLELGHLPWHGEYPEVCTVRARIYGERRVEVVGKYLGEDRHVVVKGNLRLDEEGLLVVVQDFQLLPWNLAHRNLWEGGPGENVPEPLASQSGAAA